MNVALVLELHSKTVMLSELKSFKVEAPSVSQTSKIPAGDTNVAEGILKCKQNNKTDIYQP